MTANLTHPNIVPVYNVGIDSEGTPFFSMELIPGDSLRDIIHELKKGNASYKTQYPLETLLGIFSKVCDALSYAHSREVLHLDIKPDNIRVGQFGEVFLCDWGLARVIHEEKAETPAGRARQRYPQRHDSYRHHEGDAGLYGPRTNGAGGQ